MLLGAYTELEQLIRLRLYASSVELARVNRVSSLQAGGHKSRLRSRGIEFAEVRAYEPGDDVRTIDWRVTARTGKAHTKLFSEEKERPVLVLLDQSPTMFFGSRQRFKSVLGAEAAALIAWAALDKHYRVGGVVLGAQRHAVAGLKSNRAGILRFIHQIHSFNLLLHSPCENTGDIGLETGIEQLMRIAPSGSLVFIISDFSTLVDTGISLERQFWRLGRHNDITCLSVSDPLEAELPKTGFYKITDGQNYHQVDAGQQQNKKQYRDAFQHKEDLLIGLCRKLRMRYKALSTAENLYQHLSIKARKT